MDQRDNPLSMKFTVEWYDRLASTNQMMRERFSAGSGLADGTILAAREQTAGRGRQGRKWVSESGRNLCFSLFIETDAELRALPSLSMAAALAVNDLLRGMGIRSAPKWPNDVMAGERKICGILSEWVEYDAVAASAAIPARGMIAGIGLNVNMTLEEAERIDRPATSILIESGQAADVDRILHHLLPPLETRIGEWRRGGYAAIRDDWLANAGPIGKPLTVHDGSEAKSGILNGFGDHGELLLETEKGIETIWSGDVN